MWKPAPNRSQRSKGLKPNHVVHACLVLAICIWLLYQMNRSSNNKGHEDRPNDSEKLRTTQSSGVILKLGRRDLGPRVEDYSSGVVNREAADEDEEEEEVEEEGRGGGDDEIDGNDQERAEEEMLGGAEDLIDRDDGSRDDRIDDSFVDFEDLISSDNQAENEGLSDSEKDTVEEHYKDDDNAERNEQGVSGHLRRVQAEMFESEINDSEKETEPFNEKENFMVVEGSSLVHSLSKNKENEQAKLIA